MSFVFYPTPTSKKTDFPRIDLEMVAVTRAQAKRAAALTSTAIPSPVIINSPTSIGKHSVRKHAAISRSKQSKPGSSQGHPKQGGLASKRKSIRRPVTPMFTDGESSMESIVHPKTPAESAVNQFISPESLLSSLELLENSVTAGPSGSKTGWIRFGNSLRRETVLPAGVMSQIQAQQQAALAQRADEAYEEQTKATMQQHNLTYQWYDRMMTEGLQNGQGPNAPLMLMGGTSNDTVMKDECGSDSHVNGDTDMEDCEARGPCSPEANHTGEGSQSSSSSVQETMSSTGSNSSSNNVSIRSIPQMMGKQLQPCPPGVRYSLFSTPTEIIPQY
ncbi:hypothetical protein DFH05DRAFT_1522182 [Lentinula detonsa]|uniref:Uncharacterized protein n=1 Tax=Lentinula detonsa TaxID=2804962 RepID=A0A9W8P6I0_9AGAR|nr:hypothetical protein DFH05DRAFT_1522182 [Lentinula detonsa]